MLIHAGNETHWGETAIGKVIEVYTKDIELKLKEIEDLINEQKAFRPEDPEFKAKASQIEARRQQQQNLELQRSHAVEAQHWPPHSVAKVPWELWTSGLCWMCQTTNTLTAWCCSPQKHAETCWIIAHH